MYVKIIDRGECFSTTPEFIDGVYANRTEWEKHNFYPQNGMVGEVVKRTPSAYIVKIMDGIYVPMTRNGIEEIEYDEFIAGQECNVCCGMDARQKRINSQVDDFNSMTGYNWQHLPDMRQYFKTDIISNISKLTCDFKRNIYLPDLQESAIMYTLDMCIEYQKKSGRKIHPMAIEDISNQVSDVYQELFNHQFPNESRLFCLQEVKRHLDNPNIEDIVQNYYQDVNLRYSWS